MRNGVFESRGPRLPGVSELLRHPIFTNVVRLLLLVILALGGFIWKTEMDHVSRSLDEIRSDVRENIDRQWNELQAVRGEVRQVNRDVYRILARTNDLLFQLLRRLPEQAPAASPRPPAVTEG